MNFKELNLNGNRIIVVDAPVNATHSCVKIKDGLFYEIHRKTKILDSVCLDRSQSDDGLSEAYNNKLSIIGSMKVVNENLIAGLFNPVKVGNFWEYEYNGVFYPTAQSALIDAVNFETGFENPYVLFIQA